MDFPKQLTYNLKFPIGQVNLGGAMVATPDFNFDAKSQMRLEYASSIVRFYRKVRRAFTNTIIK